uniref:recombinase family protein n=1 Tax=uncultured Rhizobium sp. TaxID=155567 RepID=UPI00261D265A|nr:recombinase family protein [uncultured Rhizobium sp.]
MLPVIAYVRVSTKEQARNGGSLDGQRLQLKEYAKARGLKIRKWFSDDTSARNEEEGSNREGFKKACELSLRTGWPILVVAASRFSRTNETYERFIEQGGRVYDLEGFGADEALMRAKIAHARLDGDKRSKATRKGQAEAKAAGKIFGTPTPHKGAAASAISRAKDADIRRRELEGLRERAAREGVSTPKALSDWLNDKGYLSAHGKPWTPSNVRGALKGRKAAKAVLEPLIPPLIDTAPLDDEMISLTAQERDILQTVFDLKAHRMTRELQAQWLTNLNGKWPRARKDQALRKARKIIELANAKIAARAHRDSEDHPDWGLF